MEVAVEVQARAPTAITVDTALHPVIVSTRWYPVRFPHRDLGEKVRGLDAAAHE